MDTSDELLILAQSLLSHKDRLVRDMAIALIAYIRRFGSLTSLLALAIALTACSPAPKPIFKPTSFRAELPRVSIYPPAFVMPGHELIVVARPLERTEVCLRVIDADAFAWHETCWEGGDSRRIPFRPTRAGRHIAYLAYRVDGGWATSAKDRTEFCALGEGADCP